MISPTHLYNKWTVSLVRISGYIRTWNGEDRRLVIRGDVSTVGETEFYSYTYGCVKRCFGMMSMLNKMCAVSWSKIFFSILKCVHEEVIFLFVTMVLCVDLEGLRTFDSVWHVWWLMTPVSRCSSDTWHPYFSIISSQYWTSFVWGFLMVEFFSSEKMWKSSKYEGLDKM